MVWLVQNYFMVNLSSVGNKVVSLSNILNQFHFSIEASWRLNINMLKQNQVVQLIHGEVKLVCAIHTCYSEGFSCTAYMIPNKNFVYINVHLNFIVSGIKLICWICNSPCRISCSGLVLQFHFRNTGSISFTY